MFLRQGICEDCGECCGSVTAPDPTSPYPKNWPEAIRTWSLDDANEVCPQLTMFGLENQGDLIGPSTPNGEIRIRGDRFYYVWVAGVGPSKDISAGHDGTASIPECPFLNDDPGDGKRPCALVGTGDEGARKKFCRPEEHNEYIPENDIWSDESKAEWEANHPSCSYTWASV